MTHASHRAFVRGILVSVSLALSFAAAGQQADAAARGAFIDRMVERHGFDRAELTALVDAAVIEQSILDAMARPAERVVPWFEYRNIFLTEERIAAGVRFWTEHAAALEEVAERYGVAPEMIVSIVGIETYFGTRMGRYRVLDALATLAFAYPPRASFFASELESFLLLTREEEVDPTAALGSYAGAMGAGQFIPSSYRAYAVDADADGRRDLWSNWNDVFGSVANYFSKHGWRTGEPVMEPATRPERFDGTGAAQQPRPRRHRRLGDAAGLRVLDRRCRRQRRPRPIRSKPKAAGPSTGSGITISTSSRATTAARSTRSRLIN